MKGAIQVLKRDPVFAKILSVHIDIPHYDGDVCAYLYSSIISQQLSTKAADAIYQRFLNQFNGNTPDPDLLLGTDNEVLRSLGLSTSKTRYVKNVAEYFTNDTAARQHWPTKTDEEIIAELTTIKGVGTWTVQMVLIFCLGRMDVFPILDLGVRNSAIALYELEGEKKAVNKRLYEIAEGWRPFRTIASLYLWAWRNQG